MAVGSFFTRGVSEHIPAGTLTEKSMIGDLLSALSGMSPSDEVCYPEDEPLEDEVFYDEEELPCCHYEEQSTALVDPSVAEPADQTPILEAYPVRQTDRPKT